jgi:hypothetical protein
MHQSKYYASRDESEDISADAPIFGRGTFAVEKIGDVILSECELTGPAIRIRVPKAFVRDSAVIYCAARSESRVGITGIGIGGGRTEITMDAISKAGKELIHSRFPDKGEGIKNAFIGILKGPLCGFFDPELCMGCVPAGGLDRAILVKRSLWESGKVSYGSPMGMSPSVAALDIVSGGNVLYDCAIFLDRSRGGTISIGGGRETFQQFRKDLIASGSPEATVDALMLDIAV